MVDGVVGGRDDQGEDGEIAEGCDAKGGTEGRPEAVEARGAGEDGVASCGCGKVLERDGAEAVCRERRGVAGEEAPGKVRGVAGSGWVRGVGEHAGLALGEAGLVSRPGWRRRPASAILKLGWQRAVPCRILRELSAAKDLS